MKTTLKNAKNIQRKWYLADAKNFILGRLSTKIARILMGKHYLDYTPSVNMGDYVVVVNCGQIKVTGRKMEQKYYHHFSGYPGGITSIKMKDMLIRRPEQVIREAVRKMLPKNKMAKLMLRRLKIVEGEEHKFKIFQTIK